ncbi:unnamed protein product [Heterobilharzia americana]|nr:unnamed protein product [Heterobilharzia americana]
MTAQDWHHDAAVLAQLINDCKGDIVMYTGAGISTSASIPDYRGTNGLWTVQTNQLNSIDLVPSNLGSDKSNGVRCSDIPEIQNKRLNNKKVSKSAKSIPLRLRLPEATAARPTFTHMAIKVLVDDGYVRHVVSQNVDGLHIRSGLKREKLSELHGNLFIEQCIACEYSVFRIFDVAETTSRSYHFTGRLCPRCRDLHPVESLIASGVLRQTAEQLAVSKYKTNVSNESLMLSYRYAARKLAKSFRSISLKEIQQLYSARNSFVPTDSEVLTKAPLLRDVVVHFFERQPEMGLAEIYRIQSAIDAVHGRKALRDAVTSTSKDCKLLDRGCKRPNEESIKYLIGSPWFKRMRPAIKIECQDLSKSTAVGDTPCVSSDPLDTPARLIIVVGSSLTVLRNYQFLWPNGLGRCVRKGSLQKITMKSSPSNCTSKFTSSSDSRGNCRLVIVNLQPTCKDGVADLVLRVPCDELFRSVMLEHLQINVPEYDVKYDPLFSVGLSLSPEEECTRTRPNIPFSSL